MYEKLNRDELVAALRASEAQAQQLQAMARQYQVVQETLNAGVVVHGADGSVRSANRMALEALGLKEIGINGRWQTDWELRDEHGQRLAPEDFPYRQVLASRRPLRDKVVQVYPLNCADCVEYEWGTHDETARAYKTILETWKRELGM